MNKIIVPYVLRRGEDFMEENTFSHAFVVCAYKESEYLEECIISLVNQTRKSEVVICTSTDCKYIRDIADKYSVKLYIRDGENDIQKDWNFGCECSNAEWVTVAHQDDCYGKGYAEALYQSVKDDEEALIFFTDYLPIKHGEISKDINCRIRRWLRMPMKVRTLSGKKWAKRMILAFGNSICCPAVSYNRRKISGDIFTSKLKFGLDWDTFLKLSGLSGRFVYRDEVLTYYRIHKQATSMDFIENQKRETEDRYMFRQFWPEFIVNMIMPFYKKAYNTYCEEEK